MGLDIPSPSVEKLNPHFILGEIIDHVAQLSDDHPQIDIDELRRQLIDVRNHQVDPEKLIRGLLKVYENTDAYKDAYEKLDDRIKEQITAFSKGVPAAEVVKSTGFAPAQSHSAHKHFSILDYFHSLLHEHKKKAVDGEKDDMDLISKTFESKTGFPPIFEDAEKTKIMEAYSLVPFQNWGLNINNTPLITYVPTKVLGLQNLVKEAKQRGRRIRCSGYRHSWAPLFSQNGEILVSMINIKEATQLPDPLVLLPDAPSDKTNDFKSLEIVRSIADVTARQNTKFVRAGSAVTAEGFRRFAVQNNVALPMDVILGEVTVGGTNGSICHGAGRRHKSINDQVRCIEYVDVNGVHQVVSDPEELKAAAGCFGLLGIVTHITYEVDLMSYAVMRPRKLDVGLAVPPLKREDVPLALQKTFTNAQFEDAVQDFENRATNDYYAEWFWFAYQSTVWVQTWNNTDDPSGARDYTSPLETFLQWVQGWLGGIVTTTDFYRALPGRWQAQLLASASMALMPPTTFDEPDLVIKTQLGNAQHFRRDDQNLRVRDMEFQIPLPPHPSDASKPDWDVARRAWWDVINLVYESVDSPMRLTLEMRVMADSDVIMAPQRGNKLGTVSIEVLTIPDAVSDDEWAPFVQKVYDMWKRDGAAGTVRPHWGKEWDGLTMEGVAARQYLKTVAYGDAIPEFKKALEGIGRRQGWGLEDLKARFSNELWDEVVFA